MSHQHKAKKEVAVDDEGVPEYLKKSKFKKRTVETHNYHLKSSARQNHKYPIKTLVIGSSLFERFHTTGRRHLHNLSKNGIFLAGVGGDCIENVWWRLRNGKLLERIEGNVEHVILMIGTNNIPRERNMKRLAAATAQMVRYIQESVPKVTVMELPPKVEPDYPKLDVPSLIKEYNAALKKVVFKRNIARKWWVPLALDEESAQPNPKMYVDNVHFSEEGYDVVAETLLKLAGATPSHPSKQVMTHGRDGVSAMVGDAFPVIQKHPKPWEIDGMPPNADAAALWHAQMIEDAGGIYNQGGAPASVLVHGVPFGIHPSRMLSNYGVDIGYPGTSVASNGIMNGGPPRVRAKERVKEQRGKRVRPVADADGWTTVPVRL